jgi:hypothetical protein
LLSASPGSAPAKYAAAPVAPVAPVPPQAQTPQAPTPVRPVAPAQPQKPKLQAVPPIERPSDDVAQVSHPVAVAPVQQSFSRILQFLQGMGVQPDPHAKQSTFHFEDPELSPVVMDIIMTGVFGAEWWAWEPETLESAVVQLVKMGMPLSQNNRDKLGAMQAIHVTNAPWHDFHAFEKVVLALNGTGANFDIHEPPSPAFILAALDIMKNSAEHQLQPDVLKHIAASCLMYGLIIFPDDHYNEPVEKYIGTAISRDIPAEEYAEIRGAWASFMQGPGMEVDPKEMDSLDDGNATDRAILGAWEARSYADEVANEMKSQLTSLATWAVMALGVK